MAEEYLATTMKYTTKWSIVACQGITWLEILYYNASGLESGVIALPSADMLTAGILMTSKEEL